MAQRLLIDAEARVGIAVIDPLAVVQLVKLDGIAGFALHEFDVIEDLTAFHTALKVVGEQRLVALLDEVFDEVFAARVTKTAVERPVANICVLVCRHFFFKFTMHNSQCTIVVAL